MILPVPLFGSSLGFSGFSGAIDRLLSIDSRAIGMARHIRGCHSLPSSTGRRARRHIRSDIPRGGMGIKRRLANDCHLENAGLEPVLERFDRMVRALVVWKLLLKEGQDTLGTLNRPDGLSRLGGSLYQREHVVVFVGDGEACFWHGQSPQMHILLRGLVRHDW